MKTGLYRIKYKAGKYIKYSTIDAKTMEDAKKKFGYKQGDIIDIWML